MGEIACAERAIRSALTCLPRAIAGFVFDNADRFSVRNAKAFHFLKAALSPADFAGVAPCERSHRSLCVPSAVEEFIALQCHALAYLSFSA